MSPHRLGPTPLDAIDLSEWAFHLTSDEYVRCAPEHHGSVQAVLPGHRRVFISVETIVGGLMSHSYIEDVSSRDHLRAISSNSADLVGSWPIGDDEGHMGPAPATGIGTRLPVALRHPRGDSRYPLIEAVARSQPAASGALQAHCATEMERKALRGLYAK